MVGRRRKQEQRHAGADLWNLSDPSLSPRQGLSGWAEISKLQWKSRGIRGFSIAVVRT
jgi:hypothetical protein